MFAAVTIAAVLVQWASQPVHGADPFAAGVRPTAPLTPEQERQSFHLPPGFEIQLVASEPDIGKVMNMAFDARGRLWVTISREYPFPAPLDKPSRDTIKVLEDFDASGRARKITTFADGLNIPIGLYPYKNGVIAWSIPNIWFLQDTDGDGKADRREILYGPLGWEQDTHGMNASFRRGFDGWLYATHGYNNDSTVRGKDGHTIQMNSGNTYRVRVDGARVEQYTWGQVNPFGMCFDALGNLYTADCHSAPIYQLLRGAYYPSFGKPDDGLGFGPVLIEHSHGSTAIAGIVYYEEGKWPAEFQGNIFTGNVMTSRINRDQITFHGSSPQAVERPDFLSTDDPWFRPVDLQLGPDGALYVADFYNRIIGHYEVPLKHPGRDRERGRIWRIVYAGEGTRVEPLSFDISEASTDQLIEVLASSNLTRRALATDQLVDRIGAPAIELLQKCVQESRSSPIQKIHALWALSRLGSANVEILRSTFQNPDFRLRAHAMRVLSETAPWNASERELVLVGLQDSDPYVRRAAADALGQHPDFDNIVPLMKLREQTRESDDHALHTVRMALRNQLRPPENLARLLTGPLGDQETRAVADAAAGVPSAEAGAFLLSHVQRVEESDTNLIRYLRHAARYAPEPQIEELAGFAQKRFQNNLDQEAAVFRAIQQGATQRGTEVSPAVRAWGAELARRLLAAGPGTSGWRAHYRSAADLVRTLSLSSLEPLLTAFLISEVTDLDTRSAVARALAALHPGERVSTLAALVGDAAIPRELQLKVSRCLGEMSSDHSIDVLSEALRTSSFRVQTHLAQALARSAPGAERLMQAIEHGQASPRLLLNTMIQSTLAKSLPTAVERIIVLTRGLAPETGEMAELMAFRRSEYMGAVTDPKRGAEVFTRNCAVCHQIGGQGAVIGPQLDGVGQRGLERLLEDVLDPNRNVDPSFRTHLFKLNDGEVISGLPRREEGETVVIAESTGRETSILKKDIESRRQSETSLMPENFGEILSQEEFNDLMSFLLSKTGL